MSTAMITGKDLKKAKVSLFCQMFPTFWWMDTLKKLRPTTMLSNSIYIVVCRNVVFPHICNVFSLGIIGCVIWQAVVKPICRYSQKFTKNLETKVFLCLVWNF